MWHAKMTRINCVHSMLSNLKRRPNLSNYHQTELSPLSHGNTVVKLSTFKYNSVHKHKTTSTPTSELARGWELIVLLWMVTACKRNHKVATRKQVLMPKESLSISDVEPKAKTGYNDDVGWWNVPSTTGMAQTLGYTINWELKKSKILC